MALRVRFQRLGGAGEVRGGSEEVEIQVGLSHRTSEMLQENLKVAERNPGFL